MVGRPCSLRPGDPGRAAYDAALGLAWLSESGCHSLLRILVREGPAIVWEASHGQLLDWGIAPRAAARFEEKRRSFDPTEAASALVSAGLDFLPYGESDYPLELTHLAFPPAGLFHRAAHDVIGRLNRCPRITIVGTRRATVAGLQTARAFASAFAARGIAVISGMALGIDAEAHRAALGVGGLTAAVLGCGVDIPYPRRHRRLYEQIAASGAVLSELPPGTGPCRWTFPHRNRLLAALGDAVLVVEASSTSGALQTADRALELGRPVFSVPGSIAIDAYRGCNMLLYEGATPALEPFATVEDFLLQTRIERAERRPGGFLRPTAGRGAASEHPDLAREPGKVGILQALSSKPASADVLVGLTGLSARELAVALAELELAGLVERAGPGTFIRAP